jgi:hypothetical protein
MGGRVATRENGSVQPGQVNCKDRAVTEADWRSSTDIAAMLAFLRATGAASDRKLRLFAVACCWRVWHILRGKRGRRAVKLAERFADGEVVWSALAAAHRAVAYSQSLSRPDEDWAASLAQAAAREAAADDAGHAAVHAARYGQAAAERLASAGAGAGPGVRRGRSHDAGGRDARECAAAAEQAAQAALLRDVVGPLPTCPVVIDTNWLTSTAATLASEMYRTRDFTPMLILADALQDAGCADDDILEHCRGGGPHVRGCWVVDLVLGKT